MPEFNELGGGALGLNEGLGRVLGMEKLGPAPTLVPEISASLSLEDPPPEWCMPMGWKRATFGSLVPAVGAEFSYFGLRNPAGSGVIARVQIMVCEQAAANALYTVRYNCTDTPTTTSSVIPSDLRWANALTTCQFISGAEAAGTGAAMFTTFVLANTMVWFPQYWVLGPGTNIVIEHNVVNTQFRAGVDWVERRAKPEEISP